MKAGGSRRPASHETVEKREHFAFQDGPSVFKTAVTEMSEVAAQILARNGLTGQDVSLFVPHQANLRIIEAAAKRMGIDKAKGRHKYRQIWKYNLRHIAARSLYLSGGGKKICTEKGRLRGNGRLRGGLHVGQRAAQVVGVAHTIKVAASFKAKNAKSSKSFCQIQGLDRGRKRPGGLRNGPPLYFAGRIQARFDPCRCPGTSNELSRRLGEKYRVMDREKVRAKTSLTKKREGSGEAAPN